MLSDSYISAAILGENLCDVATNRLISARMIGRVECRFAFASNQIHLRCFMQKKNDERREAKLSHYQRHAEWDNLLFVVVSSGTFLRSTNSDEGNYVFADSGTEVCQTRWR